jgi:hypothetical protein
VLGYIAKSGDVTLTLVSDRATQVEPITFIATWPCDSDGVIRDWSFVQLKYEHQRDSSTYISVSGLEEEELAILDISYSNGENCVKFILYNLSTHQRRWNQIFSVFAVWPLDHLIYREIV